MRTLTKLNAGNQLLHGILKRMDQVKSEYHSLPDWQKPDGWAVTEEMRAMRKDGFVRWLPSSFFPNGLTPHEKNIAGIAIRELERDGLVDAVHTAPSRIYFVRLTEKGRQQIETLDNRS